MGEVSLGVLKAAICDVLLARDGRWSGSRRRRSAGWSVCWSGGHAGVDAYVVNEPAEGVVIAVCADAEEEYVGRIHPDIEEELLAQNLPLSISLNTRSSRFQPPIGRGEFSDLET